MGIAPACLLAASAAYADDIDKAITVVRPKNPMVHDEIFMRFPPVASREGLTRGHHLGPCVMAI